MRRNLTTISLIFTAALFIINQAASRDAQSNSPRTGDVAQANHSTASPTCTIAQSNPAVEKELEELDKKWTAAELRLNEEDRKFIDQLVADDFRGINTDGMVDEGKAAYMAGLRPDPNGVDRSDGYLTRVFGSGDIAIMTHRGNVTGPASEHYLVTHVWMKRDGRWQIVAHQGTYIQQEETPSN